MVRVNSRHVFSVIRLLFLKTAKDYLLAMTIRIIFEMLIAHPSRETGVLSLLLSPAKNVFGEFRQVTQTIDG